MPALDDPRAAAPRPAWAGLTDACAFALEIAMLVLLAVTGTKIGSTLAVHVILAIALPALALGLWAIWAAPTSRRRLADPGGWWADRPVRDHRRAGGGRRPAALGRDLRRPRGGHLLADQAVSPAAAAIRSPRGG